MKAIMISIRPKWVAKILNGEKIIEIRKTMPKCDLPIDVYIYCTKGGKLIWLKENSRCEEYINGKVVAKFTLNKVEEIICRPICGEWECYTKSLGYSEISQASCLKNREIVSYLKGKNGTAIHINDLEIFDEPKEISEFKYYKKFSEIDYMLPIPRKETCERLVPLTCAPQSFCFIEV